MIQERNIGLDIVRCLSMIMICCLHVINQGGVIATMQKGTLNFHFLNAFFLLCTSSVNIFMILAGYLGVTSFKRLSRIVELYLQTAFWSIFIAYSFFVFKPSMCIGQHIWHYIPLFTKYYWFFTSYFILYFAMPAINYCVRDGGVSMNRCLLISFAILFLILPTVTRTGYHHLQGHAAFGLNYGYGPLWLGYVYCLGAFMRIYGVGALIPQKIRKVIVNKNYMVFLGIILLGTIAISYTIQVIYPRLLNLCPLLGYVRPADAGYYNSFFNILIAVLLFEIFRRIKNVHLNNLNGLFAFCSKYAFGVFLIHCQYHVLGCITGRFTWIAKHPYYAVPLTLFCGVAIFFVCIALDWMRDRLFKGVLILLSNKL